MICINSFSPLSLSFFISQITLLVNNAGVVSGRALLDTPDHLIERSFNVNVLAHFWVRIEHQFLNNDSAHCTFRQHVVEVHFKQDDDLAAFFWWMKPWQNRQTDITYAQLLLFKVFGNTFISLCKQQTKLNCATKSRKWILSFGIRLKPTNGRRIERSDPKILLFAVVRHISQCGVGKI